ncbi:MAG: DUF2971 domain-containing protein, partial [Chitinophagaceae bacterium]|nr:DUF2971 domain-containing protein [Chitinophagaceae bacterium]
IDRLIEIFETKKNTLVKPALWDDPFENFLYKQDNLGTKRKFNLYRERFYGQCWTLNTAETDALWRIYSPLKNGVRVKTTIEKLHEGFYDLSHFYPSTHFFVGKVLYQEEGEIIRFFENPLLLEDYLGESSNHTGHAQSLFVKRKEFEHENEVRLIRYADESEYDLAKMIYKYEINPFETFEELIFDPRHPDRYFEKDKAIIRELGYDGEISKSKLYQLPKLKIYY